MSGARVPRSGAWSGVLAGALALLAAALPGCIGGSPTAGERGPLADGATADGAAADDGGGSAADADGGPDDQGHWPDLVPYQEHRQALVRVEPASGLVKGGERVVLEGSGFIHAQQVLFDGARVASFQVQGPGRIEVVTAEGSPGAVDVEVDTDSGMAVLADGFRYVSRLALTAVDPGSAPVNGGLRARLSGHGFADGIEVLVGEGRAWGVAVDDDAHAALLLPPNPAGWADVWVFARGESALLRRAVLYRGLPRIDDVQPLCGPLAGGTPVEIDGAGFAPDPQVVVGSTVVQGSADPAGTRLRFVAPPGSSPGPVGLAVRTSVGMVERPAGYVYLGEAAGPTLYALSPDRGPAGGGNAFTVVGEHFVPGGVLQLGEMEAECRSLDDHRLDCVAPPHAAGRVDVSLRMDGQLLRLPAGYLYLGGLSLTRVAPAAGPEQGGTAVELDGQGFAAGVRVFFGAQEAQQVRVHPGGGLLSCVVPPGTAGAVDVNVVQGPQQAVLPAAFTYEGRLRLLALDPPQGSIAGGTLVRVIGTGLSPGLTLLFGQQVAGEATWLSSTVMTVRAPRSESEGPVDVQIPGEALLSGGYVYYDPYSGSGGVWGDPIEGAVNVAVYDSYSGDPIPGALVMLGPDPQTPWQGTTDERGLATISGPGLVGPVDIHAGAAEYEPSSFIHTRGSNATFYLVPLNPPPPSGGGPGQMQEVDGTINGDLSGLEKYIPQPSDPDWERVALVQTTQDGTYGSNPDPGPGGTLLDDGPFSITSRPGDVAVVAVGGLHNLVTDEFVPLRMGVHRYLFMPIQGTLDEVDVVLDIRLDHRIGVRLLSPPYDYERGPDGLDLVPWLQFEPEGFFQPYNEVHATTRDCWVEHLPGPGNLQLDGVLLDFETGLYTQGTRPYSMVWSSAVPLDAGVVDVGPFVGIPRLASPTSTSPLAEYFFSWTVQGGVEPDVYSMRMLGPDLGPAWRVILPGPLRSFQLPEVAGVFAVPTGRLFLAITAGRAPSFTMDAFDYGNLSVRAWDSWALDYADFVHP